MAIDNEVASRMYAQIVNGTAKADSQHVTDEETGALWDAMEAKHAKELSVYGPGTVFEMVND